MAILDPLISKHFGGYGPVRDKALKDMGVESIHVMQFNQAGNSLSWRYKTHMRDAAWIKPQGSDDVYTTILTNEHTSGPCKGMTAKEVLKGLGDGSIQPQLAAFKENWWVGECECGATDPKCCKCTCSFSELKRNLKLKLAACTHLDSNYVAVSLADWETQFIKWASPEAVRIPAQDQMKWEFPSVSPPEGQKASNEAEVAAIREENAAAVQRVAQNQITHAQNTRGRHHAVKEAKAIAKSNRNGFHSGQVQELAKGTMVVLQAPAPTECKGSASAEVPPPFYIAQLKAPTVPKNGAEGLVEVQWWQATGRTLFRFAGPYQEQHGATDKVEQGSILWWEDLPTNHPQYKTQNRSKLFRSKSSGSQKTARYLQRKVCAVLAGHSSVHSGLFAYKK